MAMLHRRCALPPALRPSTAVPNAGLPFILHPSTAAVPAACSCLLAHRGLCSHVLIEPRVATAGGSTGAGRGAGISTGLGRSGDLRSREKGHCAHWWYWERSSAGITPCQCIFIHSLAVTLLLTLLPSAEQSPIGRRCPGATGCIASCAVRVRGECVHDTTQP